MGLCLGYQALPEDSPLYRQLLDNRRIRELFALLFLYGGGPFAPTTLHIDDLSEILDHLVEHSEVFEFRSQAEETGRHLFELIGRMSARYPGLEDRRAYLEKTPGRIKERLLDALRLEGRGDCAGERLVEHLIYGCESDPAGGPATVLPLFGCESLPEPPSRLPLSFVPPAIVRAGAEILRGLTPDHLFREADHTLRADYPPWRRLHLEAAERGEVIVIGD